MNRSNRANPAGSTPAATGQSPSVTGNNNNSSKGSRGRFSGKPNWMSMATAALFLSLALLAVALLWFVILGKPNNEAQQIDKDRLQAVFLNGGQVYFGDITGLNEDYMQLRNIYYLRVNQQVQPDGQAAQTNANDISLVKLGCELHGPQDEMYINREQIVFWENLKDDGAVTKAVKEFVEKNPNGQDCNADQQQSTTPSDQPSTPETNTAPNTTTGGNSTPAGPTTGNSRDEE